MLPCVFNAAVAIYLADRPTNIAPPNARAIDRAIDEAWQISNAFGSHPATARVVAEKAAAAEEART